MNYLQEVARLAAFHAVNQRQGIAQHVGYEGRPIRYLQDLHGFHQASTDPNLLQ